MKIKRRVGLAAMMIFTLLPIALSATGSRLVVVMYMTFGCLPLLLASGLAWTGYRPGRQAQGRVLREKRITILLCLLAALSIPMTHWPLRCAFSLSRPAITQIAVQSIQEAQRDYKRNEEEFVELRYPLGSGDTGNPLAKTLICPPNFAGLPSEKLQVSGGTLVIREMNPLSSYALQLRIEAIGGSTHLSYYSEDSLLRVIPSDEVSLGNGWWFVSD